MSAQPATHLRLIRVDDETGQAEPVDSQALAALEHELEKLRGDLKNAERDLVTKRRQLAEAKRDLIRERLDHPDRKFIMRVCRYWHAKSRGQDFKGSKRIDPLAPNRFDAVARLAEMEKIVVVVVDGKKRRERVWRYEAEHFRAAIDGNEFDPFETTHKNGKVERHNDLAQTCKDVTRFERAMEKAPYAVGTFRDGDFYVPPVAGFTRLSPVDLARAHDKRNNQPQRVPSSAAPLGRAHIGGPNGCRALESGRGPYVDPLQAGWRVVRGRVGRGDKGLSASWT